MAKSRSDIIVDFVKKFTEKGFHNCYVGVTSDAHKTLFKKHNISRKKDIYHFEETFSPLIAGELKQKFMDWGMQGAADNKDRDSNIIYAYLKPSTQPPDCSQPEPHLRKRK